MKQLTLLLAAIAAALFALPAAADPAVPLIIGHRGASGERPEHTLASYERAIDEGADYIEPDLVFTSDGVLVARHENDISGTTDVADHPEFADRKATRLIDGQEVTGWFTEDFTLAELKTLRAKERLPAIRPDNTAYDGQFEVPTLAEILALVKRKEAETGRRIGIYPEMKHVMYFKAALGRDMVAALLPQLAAAGYAEHGDPVFIQCFEIDPLLRARQHTKLKLVQLMEAEGSPADRPDLTYAEMATPQGLALVATYADAVGADMRLILQPDGTPSAFVGDAHAAGLQVHAWTLRRENAFMPPALRSNDNPSGVGGFPVLMGLLVKAGVDGIFTDHPGAAVLLRASGDYQP
ncbi:MAG: glycerophosphodiester phosphodiesterase [Sphingomonadales bacterium]|nr:glycerophosphodiester phosphodiesterase [Sphingomonadales bacterium]MBD3773563.1 glycerophosphodiester phosphodiesterase [Paracoccaceae bacterium]